MRSFRKYAFAMARKDLPSRRKGDNKTHGGKTLVVAGSYGLWGAAVLCAQAAARVGSGYTYIFDPNKMFPAKRHPDFLLVNRLQPKIVFTAFAIGPGLKDYSFSKKLILKLVRTQPTGVVLDAEAINIISKMKTLPHLPKNWIITPHEGELARLLKVSSQAIKSDRKYFVQLAQKKLGCIVLLKGFRTLVANSKLQFEIQSGNPALAKAGTGDVLTGMIAGLLSQGLEAQKAACLAAYLHGLTADQWLKDGRDHLSLIASDLVERLPFTIAFVRTHR